MGELYTTKEIDEETLDKSSSTSLLSTVSFFSKEEKQDIYSSYFQSHWNKREIKIIYNMLKELETDSNEKKQKSIIMSIEELLSYKDDETHKYITKLIQY